MNFLPENKALEKNVLNMMICSSDDAVLGCASLEETDFYWPDNISVFKVIAVLIRENKNVDHFSVIARLHTEGLMTQDKAKDWIMDVGEPGNSVATYLEEFVGYLKALALRRLVITESKRLTEESTNLAIETAEVVESFQLSAQNLSGRKAGKGLASFESGTPETLQWIQDLDDGLITGVHTGIGRFDRFFGGLQGGDLITIGARPSQGKTALAMAVGIDAAKRGASVAFFSMEMRMREIMLRAYCRERNLDIHSMRTGKASFAEKAFLAEEAKAMRNLPFFIDDSRQRSPLKIEAAVRKLGFKRKPDLVIVDYLTMMRGDGKFKDQRAELSYCARAMKDLAGKLNIPVILLSQLNRTMENEKREPRSADLRETGEIEEASDIVALIHRPITYASGEENVDPRLAKILVPKFRNGPTGFFKLTFEARCAGFFDWIEPQFLDGVQFPNFIKLQAGG